MQKVEIYFYRLYEESQDQIVKLPLPSSECEINPKSLSVVSRVQNDSDFSKSTNQIKSTNDIIGTHYTGTDKKIVQLFKKFHAKKLIRGREHKKKSSSTKNNQCTLHIHHVPNIL